ncbi:MAG: hypothetical protein NVSMB21_13000 [Vulcanimicrobiaceae bacterium]
MRRDLDVAAAHALAGATPGARTEIGAHPYVRASVARALAAVNARARTHAERIARATIVADTPLEATGELTPKGTIARGAALRLRADAIAALHDDEHGTASATIRAL